MDASVPELLSEPRQPRSPRLALASSHAIAAQPLETATRTAHPALSYRPGRSTRAAHRVRGASARPKPGSAGRRPGASLVEIPLEADEQAADLFGVAEVRHSIGNRVLVPELQQG